jgi:hypothetical protein
MQENERWMALVQERNRIRQIAAERSQLIHNAKGKTVEYFDEKIAATKELEKRAWLVVAALESEPQVFEWVQKKWVAETLLANQLQGLRMCFADGHYWLRMPVLIKMMQIPEMMDHLVECMTDGRDIGYLQYYQKVIKKTGRGFTREHCLARNGAALRQRKVIDRPRKIKELIKLFRLSKSDLASVGVPWPA